MQSELSRPIVGIENRTAQEVFDIMCDRFRTEFGNEEAPRYTTLRLHEEIRKAEERGRQHEREAVLSAAEPVRWIWEERRSAGSDIWDDMYDDEPPAPHKYVRNVRPLYAAPPAPSVAVKALQELHSAEHAKLGEMLLDKSEDGQSKANWQGGRVNGIAAAISALSAQVQDVAGWQSMDSAPKEGKHCLLAVKSGPFVYAVQGAYLMGEWGNAADIHSEPLCWMPLTRIPPVYLPWTDEFAAAAPAKQEGGHD